MKNKIVLFSVLAVFALFAVIAVPSVSAPYPANAIYLAPEDSDGLFCENNTLVEVWVNANVVTTGVQTSICFDPTCVNITDVDYTGGAWPPLAPPGWTHWGDHVTLIGTNLAGEPAGDKLFATIRLHCVKESGCISDLEFRNVNVLDLTATPIDITLHNGTFTCRENGEKPDLNVTEITVNYDAPKLGGRAVGPEPGPGVHTQCNNISAVIEEDNGVATGAFDVTFKVDGTTLCTVRVPGLTGGATKTVYCNCSWRPMAGDDFAIKVTVDSNDEILESDETNNTMWNRGTAVSNGYKGDGWQGPDKNLTNVQCHDQDTINLIYSVGDSYYLSAAANPHWTEYTVNWTAGDLPVLENANIEKAWLYVYYCWDKKHVMPGNVNLKFNDNDVPLAIDYSDWKGFGNYYGFGMLKYDVKGNFVAAGNNKAVLANFYPDGGNVSMKGMLLMVVYKHPDEPERIICIDEGFDIIYAHKDYGISSKEATTYAPFECCEPIPLGEIGKATLITVAPNAADGGDKNRLSFNDGLWKGVWDHYEGASDLGIAETNVLAHLKATDNIANFQSHIPEGETKGDFMEASNAFLILEKGEGVEKPDLVVKEKWEEERRGKYKVYFVVENIGTVTAPGGHHATLSVDGIEKERKLIRRALGPDETYESSFRTRVKCTGDFDTIRVCADDFNVVDELDETNNCLENEWICEMVGKPDLVIVKKWEIDRRGTYKVKFEIKNIGTAPTPRRVRHYAVLFVDGVVIAEKGIRKTLKPGEIYKSHFRTRITPSGAFDTIKVCADKYNNIDELNEENNCLVNIHP